MSKQKQVLIFNGYSVKEQVENWIMIGRNAEQNPNLSFEFIKVILEGEEEKNHGATTDYNME